MAENVGSVSIELLLDREQFDADLLKLAEEGPIDLDFRSGLDLRQLEKDWSSLKRRTLDVAIDTVEIKKQLDSVLVERTIDIRARLDKWQFYRDLDSLGDGRSTTFKVALDDQFDSRAMDLRIKQATADRVVNFIGKADFQALEAQVRSIKSSATSFSVVGVGIESQTKDLRLLGIVARNTIEALSKDIRPNVQDQSLTDLNEHLFLKQRHWAETRRDFANPLTAAIDIKGSEINQSPNVIARVSVDDAAIDRLSQRTVKVRGDVDGLSNQVDKATKKRSVLVGGGGGSLTLNPFKFVRNLASNVLGGALSGIGMELSRTLGGGVSKAIESAISGTFGSTNLLGEMLGKKLTTAIGGGLAKGGGIVDALAGYVESVETSTKAGSRRKRTIQNALTNVKTAPTKIIESLTSEVGLREVEREKLYTKGSIAKQRTQQEATVAKQATVDADAMLLPNAKLQAREEKRQAKIQEKITANAQKKGAAIGTIAGLEQDISQFNATPLGVAFQDLQIKQSRLKNFKPVELSKNAQIELDRARQVLANPTQFTAAQRADARLVAKTYQTPETQLKIAEKSVIQAERKVAKLRTPALSEMDQKFRAMDIEAGREVSPLVDELAPQLERLKKYQALTAKVKAIDAATLRLKKEQEKSRKAAEESSQTFKVAQSFTRSKPVEGREAEIEANFSKVSALPQTIDRMKAQRAISEQILTTATQQKQPEIAQANEEITVLERRQAVRAERKALVVVKRSQQVQSLVEENAPIADIEQAQGKMQRSEQINSRSVTVQKKIDNLKKSIQAKSKLLRTLANGVALIDDAIVEAQTLYDRAFIENETLQASKSKSRGIERKQQQSKRLQDSVERPKEYIELARIVMGKDFDEAKLPKLVQDSGLEAQGAMATYTPATNQIKVNPKTYAELQSGKMLSKETTNTVAEELAHSYDMDFGSEKGLLALKQGRVARTAAVPTRAEMETIAPSIGGYEERHRQIEVSGKTRALRAETQYQEQRGQAYRNTEVSGDIRLATGISRGVDRSALALKKLKKYAQLTGQESDKAITFLEQQTTEIARTSQGLLPRTKASLSPTVDRVPASELEQVKNKQLATDQAILDKTQEYIQLYVVRSVPLVNTEALQEAQRDTAIVRGAQRRTGLKSSLGLTAEVATEIASIEKESQVLKQSIAATTPQTAKQQYTAIAAKSAELQQRFKEVQGAIGILRDEAIEANPQSIAQSEKRIEFGETAKAKAIATKKAVQSGAAKVLAPQSQALPTSTVQALPASPIVENAPALESLTQKQLYSIAKSEGIQDVNSKTKKGDLVSRLEREVGYAKLEPIVANIDQYYDRKGKPVKGYDNAAEKNKLAEIKIKEKAINERIAQAKMLMGVDRVRTLEQLNIQLQQFSDELASLKTQPLSPRTVRTIGQTEGRVNASISAKPVSAESRDNRIIAAKASLAGPSYGRSMEQMVVDYNPASGQPKQQTIDIQPTRLARSSADDGRSPLARLGDRVKGLFGGGAINQERLGLNYQSYLQTYAEQFGGSAVGGLAPKLQVSDKDLKGTGASALYDTKQNAIVVSSSLARTLSQPVQKLGKKAEQLKPLTHELQHAHQFSGGQLNLEQASLGLGTSLQGDQNLTQKQKLSVDQSVSIAATANPGINQAQLRKLEIDAYAAESRTLETILGVQAKVGASSNRAPLNAIGLKIAGVMDAVRNKVGDGVDLVREKVLGQSVAADISRTNRSLAQLNRTAQRIIDRYSGVIDGAMGIDSGNQLEESQEQIQQNRRANKRFFSIAKRYGFAVEGDARHVEIQGNESPRSRIRSEFKSIAGFATQGYQSVRSDLAKGDAKKLGMTAIDARSLSTDIGVSQAIAQRDGKVEEAKALGKLKRRVDVTADRAERISGQDSFSGGDVKKINELKNQFNDIYRMAGRPMPHPFNEILNATGGLTGNLKKVVLGLTGLPFAMAGVAMAVTMMQKLAAVSIESAIAADRIKTSLTFSTGSKAGGEKAFTYASNQADALGIDRKSSIEGYSKLRASTKGKLSEGQTNDIFEGVAAASTTLGLSADDQNGVFLALGQIASKGSAQAEEVRGQIGERLPGFFSLAARSMNMSEAQLGKAMESGSVSSEQFLPRVGTQLKQEFGSGAKDASQNLQSSMFRLEGAKSKVTENVGGTLAVPVKLGVDGAIGGMTLLMEHGATLIAMLGTRLVRAALTAAGSFIAYNGGLMAMASSTLAAVGGIAGITSAISSAAAVIAPFLAKFLLMNAAIEIGKTLFSSFTPDDMGSRFEGQANKIKQSLQEIEDKGKNAQKAASDLGAPSKGLDINAATFGLSGMVGINKGDDLVKGVNSTEMQTALSVVPIFGFAKNMNEANGGKGFATMQEVQYNRSKIALGEQGDGVYKATGGVYDRLPELTKAARESQVEQNTIDSKQAERARILSTGSPDKNRVAVLDTEIKQAADRRDKSGAGFADQKNLIESQITDLKAQKEAVKTNADYSPAQRKEMGGMIDAQLGQLEAAKRQLDGIDKKFGGSADVMGKFNVALSEMAAKIEEASAIAKNAFNQAEVKRLGDRKSDRGKDEFATQNNAVRQAENEQRRADGELKGNRSAIAEVDKMIADPTVKRELSKIAINGKSIDGETSAQQLEQAKVGRSDKEKGQIDKLILRRKTIDNLPEVEKNSLEAEDKLFGAKSARALEKTDRASLDRDNKLKAQEGRANYDLIKAQRKGGMNESDVEINKASIGKASADRQVNNINANIKDVDKLFKEGTISKEEHTKRSAALRNSLVDATVKAAQAELDVEKAKNKKILEDHETNIKRRSVERQERTGAATIGLIRQQMGNKINESDVDIKKAEIQKQSADGEAADVRRQMGEVDQLRAQGILSEQEYIKRKLELRSKLVDADVKAAEAALAVEQAKNRKILNEWAQTIKKREVGAQRVEGAATVQLIKGQMGNKMSEEDVAVKKAEIQGKSSNAAVANLEAQMREVAALKSRGVITEEDYNKRILDIESNLIAAKTRSAEAQLAIEQAKNRKIVAEFDQMQKRQEMMISNDQVASGTQIKRAQLGGQIIGKGGQTETIKYDIIATEKRVKMADEARNKDVELRKGGKISEKDFDDRMATNNGKFRAEEEKLVNLLIQQRQGIYQQEHDAFSRANSGIIRGLELRKQRSETESRLDGSKQGVMESVVGLARAKSDNAVAASELSQAGGKGDNGVSAASIRLGALDEIQRAEMMILDLKEKQTQASLRQSMIEAQIAFGKQKIAVSESKRKLKDAVLTGDQNAIANATEDLSGQQQILGMEGEKISALETQNRLAMQKLGIDRQSATLGMGTERMRAQTALIQAQKGTGGNARGDRGIQQNRVIGGESFFGNNTGVDMMGIMNARPTMQPIASGSWRDLAVGLPTAPGTTAINTDALSPIDRAQQASTSADRAVTQATGLTMIDDRGIIAAIDRLSAKLDRLPNNGGDRSQQPGYSDYLTANTNAKFART